MNVFTMLSYPFIQRALLVGVLVSLCAALLGVVLVLKHYSLIGHGLADVGFAAMSLALAMGWQPLYVSIPVVLAASFFIMLLAGKKGVDGDAAVGMVATVSLAAGIIITSLSRGFNMDVYDYMFGSILAVSESDLLLSATLAAVVLALFAVFYNRLLLVTYDEDYARTRGINITFYRFLISFLTALVIVLGMRMMGTLLISSLIIFPAMTARRLTRSFKGMVAAAAVVSAVCFVLGLLLSLGLNLPTGASVVAANAAALVVSLAIRR